MVGLCLPAVKETVMIRWFSYSNDWFACAGCGLADRMVGLYVPDVRRDGHDNRTLLLELLVLVHQMWKTWSCLDALTY